MTYSNSSKFLLFNTFAITLATFMFNPYLVIGAKEMLNLDYSDIGFYLMIALAIGSFTSLTIGTIAPKNALLNLLLISGVGSAISFLLMISSGEFGSNQKYVFLFSLILLRVCMACATMITRTVHMMTNIDKDCSKLFALAVTFFGIGNAIGPLIGGFVFDSRGYISLLYASMGIMFLSFLVLGCASFSIKNELSYIEGDEFSAEVIVKDSHIVRYIVNKKLLSDLLSFDEVGHICGIPLGLQIEANLLKNLHGIVKAAGIKIR